MTSTYDYQAFPAADSGPIKFPAAPHSSAASYFDSYTGEMARAAKTIDPVAFERAAEILLEAYLSGARM